MDEIETPTRDALVLLEKAYGTAIDMIGRVPAPPATLRIAAGDVVVEVQWVAAVTGTVIPAPPDPQGPAAVAEPVPSPDRHSVLAPTVGVFYQAPEPGAPPFVKPGDVVQPGQRVAILEAMKIMIPVESDRAGRVVEVLVADGDQVEYATPLMLLAPVEEV